MPPKKTADSPRDATKLTVIEESTEEMENLAKSLQRALDVALRVKELTGLPGASEKLSKKQVKELEGIAKEIANAVPPAPLSDRAGR